MDQKRLVLAIAISVAILLGFQFLMPRPHRIAIPPQTASTQTSRPVSPDTAGAPTAQTIEATPPREVPRLQISSPRLRGSINLRGATLDDLVLLDYRETLAADSPLVRLLEPRADGQPYYVQFGWATGGGTPVKLPDADTVWAASGDALAPGKPVTLAWDNGAGLRFEIALTVDDNYMFAVNQSVRNDSGEAVALYPWSRVDRDYTPQTSGYNTLFEGMVGFANGSLQEISYSKARDADSTGGIALTAGGAGGWAGITDKYWLAALIPNQATPVTVKFRHVKPNGTDRYQVDYATSEPVAAAPGGVAEYTSQLFAGAKVVSLIDSYEARYQIDKFYLAVDWGWFWFLTKPIFYALDWLNGLFGNFGVAILVFTVFVKLLFFPLTNKSYKSMGKMRLLGPKMTALRERLKDEPQKLQQEMMGLYKAEGVNPVSGCLPMLVQLPVFFSLYKVLVITIEMRHAPFFGWIHDLSAVDPTNVFNLFGLLPFDPTTISPFLQLGAWPLIMGVTMFLQQRLNPPPPDPVQARIFQWMPLIFVFFLAKSPAGLVIYWSWNNTLTMLQQWFLMRRMKLAPPRKAQA